MTLTAGLRKLPRLVAETVPVSTVTPGEKRRMFDLMAKYYDGVSRETFLEDLSEKDHVIILRNAMTGYIEGFSTLKVVELDVGGRLVRGVFSGDTIVERCYWGTRVLGKAFLRYLFVEKLKRPFKPFYWYLISKGYKTYMLMANNFREHYPRYEKETPPAMAELLRRVYSTLYPESFDPQSGLIKHTGETCRLKPGVAPPTESMRRAHPRIDFFEKVNPEWHTGTELCCVAKMTLWMPLYYSFKAMWRQLNRLGIGRLEPVLNR